MAFVLLLGFVSLYWPGTEQFPVPSGQQFIVAIYACDFTCGHSFTVCSGWGIFSFSRFSVFSTHTLLPLYHHFLVYFKTWRTGARFSKAQESFRAHKAIFRSSMSKNGDVYTPETSCMKETSLHP